MPTLQSSAVLLLFSFLIGLSCSLNPRDPNVCSLWEFTTSVKESYSHPYDHVTEEPCSDPQTSYRCLRHITYKTAYRQAVKTDYRKRYQCCPGYYESGDKCVRCTKECVHGRCVAPDRCQCEGGWRGDDCSSCDDNHWGPGCSQQCKCQNRALCDPAKGACQCSPGFIGRYCCNEECAAGTYGQDCKGVCDCANGARCYNIDGACLCEPGFSGPHCRDRMCSPGKYGMHCERTCLCQDKHTLCHPMKGECTCQPGWAGLYCNETCAHGFYGHGCLEPCLCVNGGVCDGATGRCQCAPGFTGIHCESPCKSGTYGKNCSLECSCENFVDCSSVDGTCFCKEWRGLDCSTPCSEGTWGPGCNATCHCANGAKCNPADGSCSCTAGWQGVHCDQPCPMGTFGPGCLKRCDCVHADGCQAATGECHCLPGWWPRCSDPCSDGLWGRHCNQTCFKHCPNSDTCLRETGACVCRSGFWGITCQNCRAGMYGDQCSSSCASCGQSYRCHHVTGECDCLPGYTGPNCDQCPDGYYGKQCSEVCVKCANNSTCNHRDGHCECLPGWTATDCSICGPGRFGPFCAQTCSCQTNVLCDRFTGDCLCESGGDDCKQEQTGSVMVPLPPGERESWGAIGGIVVLVILVVLLLALLLLYRRRQKDKQNNTPTVSFSTSRTVNSEYAVPVPHSYHHYYSNPSYHTLSQNRPPLPHLPNNHDRTIKNTNNQLFCSVKNAERERRGLFGVETNATLPADWKHHEPRKDSAFGIDRSYSYSASLGKYYNNSLSHAPHDDPQSHYDLPVNSHIPGHYDLPPVRRP
uniref:Platelet endothelial aggregation receptor 1-like n=1 Tax=Stegastes partitus TaxID=144197 RepID=A0A3B5A358_9TELE